MINGPEVVDFHGHVGRMDWAGMRDDPVLMLHAMDKAGVDVSSLFSIYHPDGTTGNDSTARFIAQHPDRLVGFAYVSLLMPDQMVPELTRAIDELNFVAIKLYPPYTPWAFDQPPWFPIYEFANERGLAIIFHTGIEWQSHPKSLAAIAPQYPKVNFVAGHSGNTAEPRAEAHSRQAGGLRLVSCYPAKLWRIKPTAIQTLEASTGKPASTHQSTRPADCALPNGTRLNNTPTTMLVTSEHGVIH